MNDFKFVEACDSELCEKEFEILAVGFGCEQVEFAVLQQIAGGLFGEAEHASELARWNKDDYFPIVAQRTFAIAAASRLRDGIQPAQSAEYYGEVYVNSGLD